MRKIHIVIPDLFLPQRLAAYAGGDLRLPALEKLLARAQLASFKSDSLEAWLCEHFGVEDMAIAPLTLLADGVPPGDAYWLRADPVGISMQSKQMIPQSVSGLGLEESASLCASLNAHFAADGLRFFAPHPQRWYLQLEKEPRIQTHSLPQIVGTDMHSHLPYGDDALRWHSIFNEIQMLFYEHAVNQAREQRGEPVVSALWLWGGGRLARDMLQPCASVAGDSELACAFAQAAGISATATLPAGWAEGEGDLLLVCEGLRSAMQQADIAAWRNVLQQFEENYAQPLLAALEAGKTAQITLDVPSEGGSRRFVMARSGLWKFWRRPRPLLHYSPRQDTPGQDTP